MINTVWVGMWPLRPWNPKPILDLVRINFATLN